MSASLRDAIARFGPREVHGIAAVLLPFREDGTVDWAGFEAHLQRTRDAGLDCAVNMDTGFGDLLSPDEREAVLDAARRALGPGVRFFAGAYATGSDEPLDAYARSIAAIEAHEASPVIVQCAAMHALDAAGKAALYAQVASATSAGALAFELSPRFAPHGEIWDSETFTRLLEIPQLRGAKHSSLDRGLELERLAVRDRQRPDWRVYTGNDLAIDMVGYGSDYLLGLATFSPQRFAERDACLAADDAGFAMRNDALQHLGNVAFRAPIPAYKHAAGLFLSMCGLLDQDAIHPRAACRPDADRVLLFDCARRLGLLADPDAAWATHVAPFVPDAARDGRPATSR